MECNPEKLPRWLPVWLARPARILLLALIATTVLVVAWHLYVVWPRQLPVVRGEFVHGYVLAPHDLKSAEDIKEFTVNPVSPRVATLGRVISMVVTEQWVVTLVYVTPSGIAKTKEWEFSMACDEDGELLTLDQVNDLNLVREYEPVEPQQPLQTVHVRGPAALRPAGSLPRKPRIQPSPAPPKNSPSAPKTPFPQELHVRLLPPVDDRRVFLFGKVLKWMYGTNRY
jgi:hypothetical protein